jgi:hypothetical protein
LRRLALLCTTIALAALAVGVIARIPAAQTTSPEDCRSGGPIAAAALPETLDLENCPIGGRVITDNGIGTVVPGPGESVYVDALTRDGSQELEVTRYRDGTVELEQVGDESLSEPLIGAQSSLGECSDAKFKRRDYKVFVVLRGYFNPGTTPEELSRKAAVRAVRRGTADITSTRNNCGFRDRVPSYAGMSYEGSTRRRAQIGTGGGCGGQDRYSVVSFGTLPKGALAVTCTESHKMKDGWHTKWSDIMLNKARYNWTTRPQAPSCGNGYDLESTVAHERGHTFGLGHAAPESSHRYLTMSESSNGPCQSSERSLGRGDVLGLARKY